MLRATAAPSQAPPAPPPVEVQMDSVAVSAGVKLLRGSCQARLKYEVEYGLKRGSTDNTYIITPPGSSTCALIDVPNEAYQADGQFVSAVSAATPLERLDHIILTHLDPKAIPCLEALLRAATAARTGDSKVQLVLTNPAMQLLQNSWGETPDKAALLQAVDVRVVKSGGTGAASSVVELPGAAGGPPVELRMVLTPTPRWPDLMAVYYAPEQLLFSSKLFSAQMAPSDKDNAFDTAGWEEYGSDWQYFFDCMLAPVARQMATALDRLNIEVAPPVGPVSAAGRGTKARNGKLLSRLLLSWSGVFTKAVGASSASAFSQVMDKLFPPMSGSSSASTTSKPTPSPTSSASSSAGASSAAAGSAASASPVMRVRSVCPMHGPVVSVALGRLVREYRSWVDVQVAAASTALVTVLYASAYGNTASLAQAISRGVIKGGVAVDTLNLETVTLDEVSKALEGSAGFVIGSPTLGGHLPTQVQLALGAVMRDAQNKQLPCGVFGSFGWSGEAVDEMEKRLRDAGFGFAFNAIRVKFRPVAKDLMLCEESGRALAQAVRRRLKARELKPTAAPLASGPQLAMGRVLGSLCVVTARDEEASSAMLASWVSQASFDPPGLTVSVKKDRALEPLLVTGGKFSISTVAEGQERPVMKLLARPFSPGEDRLAGLETIVSEVTGCRVLQAGASYLDCQVQSRMEAGDHWVVYASVLGGKVLNDKAQTAVHHRKVGNHY